jgi:hypothetical protein
MSVTVTTEQMYQLLVKIDQRLIAMSTSFENLDERVADHEARIRAIESEENLVRRVVMIEGKLEELQKRVWAIPGAATLIALAALIATFIR